jgi:hypothetical protein
MANIAPTLREQYSSWGRMNNANWETISRRLHAGEIIRNEDVDKLGSLWAVVASTDMVAQGPAAAASRGEAAPPREAAESLAQPQPLPPGRSVRGPWRVPPAALVDPVRPPAELRRGPLRVCLVSGGLQRLQYVAYCPATTGPCETRTAPLLPYPTSPLRSPTPCC